MRSIAAGQNYLGAEPVLGVDSRVCNYKLLGVKVLEHNRNIYMSVLVSVVVKKTTPFSGLQKKGC